MSEIAPLPTFLTRWTGFVLGHVAELSDTRFQRALEPLGIAEQHVGVLLLLEHLGPQVQAHMSPYLRIDKATMVRLVNDLERARLVERRPNPHDRRAVLVHLTDAGQHAITEVNAIMERVAAEVFGVLTPDEQQTVRRLLTRVAEHVPPLDETGTHHE
jgi:MarR family transcriptional regulator, lower aerobic nicotinate degradation pathway regulator